MPVNPMLANTPADNVAWALPRRRRQPVQAFSTPVRLSSAADALWRSDICCTRTGPGNVFRRFAEQAKADASRRDFGLDASHNPHITMPDTLAP